MLEVPARACELVGSGVTGDSSKARELKVTGEGKIMAVTYTIARTSRGLEFDFGRGEIGFFGDLMYYLPLLSGGWSRGNVGLYLAKKLFKKP